MSELSPENQDLTTPSNNNVVVITPNMIDVEKVFSSKAPKAAKWVPGFVFSYLKRIIHQEEVNGLLYKHKDADAKTFAEEIRKYFQVELKVVGLDRIPKTGRPLLAANHPLGGLDGILLMDMIGQVRTDIQVVVNDLLMNLPQLKPYFVPVNKHGSNKENLTFFNNAFASDCIMLYFPAGLVSRKQNGIIKDLEWQPTFLKKCIQTKRDVIPVHVGGQNSNFFYNLANWRKKLGVKGNIEMLYLVDEMFNLKHKDITITIGKPIPYTYFDKSKTLPQWCELLKEHVYKLPNQPDLDFMQ